MSEVPADVKALLDSEVASPPSSILKIDGDTATITITGPLTKNGPDILDRLLGFGGTGYNEIMRAVEQTAADAAIKNVDFIMDTPGGEAFGVDEAWQAIAALSATKNTTAVNAGRIASAGYYIATATNRIIATAPLNMAGGIGVVLPQIQIKDFDGKIVRRVTVTSGNAPNKRPDLATKTGKAILQDTADAIERIFYRRVSQGRGVSNEQIKTEFGRGGMLIAKDMDSSKPDALKAGMIDEVFGLPEVETGAGDIGEVAEEAAQAVNIKHNTGENMSQDLETYLSENPSARSEYEKRLKAARLEAKDECYTDVKKLEPFIGSEAYGAGVTKICLQALRGEVSADVVSTTIALKETEREAAAQKDAVEEQAEDAPNRPVEKGVSNDEGIIETQADYAAALKRLKGEV